MPAGFDKLNFLRLDASFHHQNLDLFLVEATVAFGFTSDGCINRLRIAIDILPVRSLPRHLGRIRYRVLADRLGRTGYKTGSVGKVLGGKR